MANAEKSQKYAAWIVANKDKKGTPEFETVKQAYLQAKPSSAGEKTEAALRGVNAGLLADVIGAPVDLINQAPRLLNLLPGEQGMKPITENPTGGSQSIRNFLSDTFDIGYKDKNQLPVSQRPYAVGGETVGQTIGTVLPFLGAASKVRAVDAANKIAPKGNVAANIVDDLVRTTAQKPATTTGVEIGLAVPAGIGAGLAEQINPDNSTSRMYGELAGAFSPLVVTNVLPSLTSGLYKAIETRLPGGVKRSAATAIQGKVAKDGGNSEKIAELLRAGQGSATSAQMSGDPSLLSVQNAYATDGVNPQFGQAVQDQTERAITEFNDAYKTAINSGDPELMRQAAAARQQYVIATMNARVKTAEKTAKDLANRNLPRMDKNKINTLARDVVEAELRLARKTERGLWSAVDRDLVVPSTNTLSAVNEVKAGLASGEQLPAPLTAVVRDIKKKQPKKNIGKNETTSGNLLRTRSRYLELAREARASKKFGDARMYQKVADAMLDDLDPITGGAAQEARVFSRQLNEKFTQGFMGKTLGYSKDGGLSVAPERTLEVAQSGSDVQQSLNLQAMRDASGEQVYNMTGRQQEFFQSLAADTTNFDGTVNPASLERFIQGNQKTLTDLGLGDVLSNVSAKARLSERLSDLASKGTAFATNKSTAAKVLGTNNLGDLIKSTLTSGNISGGLSDLARLARKSGDPAVLDGLRSGVYDTLLTSATTQGGLVSGNRLDALLGVKTGGQTLKASLKNSGVFTQGQMRNIDQFITKTKQFEAALANTSKADNLLGGEDIFFDLLLRIGGASVGSASALGQATGAPLVAAGAGSRAARAAFDKVPKLKVRGIIEEALLNPKLMAELLSKPTAITAKAARNRRINAILIQSGVFDGSEIFGQENQQGPQ